MLCSALLGIVFPVFAFLQTASAHESRPAYMQVTEVAPKRYEIVWRTPVRSGMRLPVVLRLPDSARNVTEPTLRELQDSLVERRLIKLDNGLTGTRIEIVGLQATITDALVRVQLLDGTYSTTLVRPSKPWIEIAASRSSLEVASAYLMHGIEHILLGYDHLLFVLALILIVRRGRVLLITVTAFTVAHSITLSLATLEVVHVPGPPVEATIALSILLLACEIIRSERGEASLTAQWPWLVAFSFGLLHGFGFAGALTEIGLPQGDIPLALFAFNVGVEVGQLLFIAAVLGALRLAKWIKVPVVVERHARLATTYAIGIMAAYWFMERLAGFAA
ncbi:HupE/UreJ family protein [Bradyrhizobium yuanmingense]|uniref:HupE/UreJ family protein n=1 Tax=Bradyrhizobium yuanmingense TaxID=108015 RepID=UPI0023BA38CA|nr:HupE/UreJ family protein [Bradyrhizobium yuanmingense]MDF0578815.1 HupE/UreJ family protein [Bradyrhizobium yuanmingense]